MTRKHLIFNRQFPMNGLQKNFWRAENIFIRIFKNILLFRLKYIWILLPSKIVCVNLVTNIEIWRTLFSIIVTMKASSVNGWAPSPRKKSPCQEEEMEEHIWRTCLFVVSYCLLIGQFILILSSDWSIYNNTVFWLVNLY